MQRSGSRCDSGDSDTFEQAERVGAGAKTDARGRNCHGAEQGLESTAALIEQRPELQPLRATPGTGDVLINLALYELLLQFGQQRLGFGKAQTHTVGGEITEAAVKGAEHADRHLALTGFSLRA